jgi:AraC-like DNA-binding protein
VYNITTEILLASGDPLYFKPAPAKKFRGVRLPGAELLQADQAGLLISIHDYVARQFCFSLRSMHSTVQHQFRITESHKWLRLEAVLTGELQIITPDGNENKMRAGSYRFTDDKTTKVSIQPNYGCHYFVAFLSPELLSQTAAPDAFTTGKIKMMSISMREIIDKMLVNPFAANLRDGYYDNSLRDFLFSHIAIPEAKMPGELTAAEIAAAYEADRIIASNLDRHFTIGELARLVRTNAFTLKTAFSRVFGMGLFERHQQLKMERAKYLLEFTDDQIQALAQKAGYDSVTGFIHSFRNRFGLTPRTWRKKSRGT